MQYLKIIVGASNLLLLLAGASIWGMGVLAQKPSHIRTGQLLLSAWVVYDFIALVFAVSLGWLA